MAELKFYFEQKNYFRFRKIFPLKCPNRVEKSSFDPCNNFLQQVNFRAKIIISNKKYTLYSNKIFSASDLEKDVEMMRKEILTNSPWATDPKFDKLPRSKSLVWQQITSGKHYTEEYVSRGIFQPWVTVVTDLAREAAKAHYKEKKLHGKIERIHVDRVYQERM